MMTGRNISRLRPFGPKSEYVNVIIETPKGSHMKFKYDEKENLFVFDKTLETSLARKISDFFVVYNKLQGKRFKTLGYAGPERASALIRAGMPNSHKQSSGRHRAHHQRHSEAG